MQKWVTEINKAIVLEGYLTVRHKNKRMIESKIRFCTTLSLPLMSSFKYLFFTSEILIRQHQRYHKPFQVQKRSSKEEVVLQCVCTI